MNRHSTTTGLVVAVIAAVTFGASGAFIKPLLESGWSPAAAVTVRVLVGGLALAPIAAFSLRGRWSALWRGRWRVLGMAAVGVAGTQLFYFAAIQTIPVGTGILIEYMAPLLLVVLVWVRSRRMPKAVVLIGSVVALAGLVLVVSPGGEGGVDVVGLLFALGAIVGLASSGLLLGAALLGLTGLVGIVPFTANLGEVPFLEGTAPWWIPMIIVGVVATAIAYATSIAATEMLGSRLASFAGLLEVVAATFYAWLLLGERLTLPQLLGGVLILVGIGFVRSEKTDASLEPASNEPLESARV